MAFNMEPLKEPRGFLRVLQWFFAMIAFATCCDFSYSFGFTVTCTDPAVTVQPFQIKAKYPFSLDEKDPIKYSSPVCEKADPDHKLNQTDFNFPGDSSSNAEFFVFLGVITWLYCFATLALYVFYSYLYTDEQKNYPKIDLIVAAVLGFIWLAAASAWAHGLLSLKSVADVESWIFTDDKSPCYKPDGKDFKFTKIKDCQSLGFPGFGTGNASILLGFLNCFLWTCNTWFLYKETAWYRSRNPAAQGGV